MQIEQYLEGRLSAEAKEAFEAELQANPELRTEVAYYRALIKGIRKRGEREFETRVAAWENRIRSEQQSPARPLYERGRGKREWRRPLFYMAAAAAVILLVVLTLPVLRPGPPTPAALYAEAYRPYPDLMSIRGEEEAQNLLSQAMDAYNKEDYSAALQHFDTLLGSYPDSIAPRLYAGISRLETDEPQKAIEEFRFIIASGDPRYREAAQWYLALACLKQGDLETARNQLQAIAAADSHDYQSEAKSLLAKM